VTSRSVGRSKASNLLFGVLTKRRKHPGLRKVVHPSRGDGGTKVLVRAAKCRERLQPLRAFGVDDIGCSESRRGGEHALARHRSTDADRGSFAQGLPAHAARRSNTASSPLFPASQTIGLAPGTERYGTSPARDGAERNGRRHGSSAFRCTAQVGHRAEPTWTGATASHGRGSTARRRARVSESCCRDR